MSDLISRQVAIDAVDSETVSTNPEHFKSSEKFIKFMDDADISSFGMWQWANGFNTALIAITIQLKKLPSAQPEVLACGEGVLNAQSEIVRCKDCKHWNQTFGETKGDGFGKCDFLDAKYVTCNGYCYWAERREDGGFNQQTDSYK